MDHLNAFEIAVLERIAEVHPQYQAQLRELCASGQISGRDWNGHGGFINFAPNPVTFDPPNIELHPQAEISLQSLKHGIGAILFVRSGKRSGLRSSLTMKSGGGTSLVSRLCLISDKM